jgi:ferritin-like metal-binding protein YciE
MKNEDQTKTAVKESDTARGKTAAAGLKQFFINDLKDIYWAEKALVKAIPKMISNASDQELIEALTEHLDETHEHVIRLEEVFAGINMKASTKKCAAMEGLIKEAEEIMEEAAKGIMRDAGIIAGGQKIEHYEIASYGTLGAYAEILGYDDAVELLHQTLEEERAADEKLTAVTASALMDEVAIK